MRDKFAQGGTAAQEATQQTIDALFALDDKVKMNQAGVDLFGTRQPLKTCLVKKKSDRRVNCKESS